MKGDGSDNLNLIQIELLNHMMLCEALRFSALDSEKGGFKLKSGRVSPYFLNAGLLNDGKALFLLGRCYAEILVMKNLSFDVLYGPAYKGIPLATTTATALHQHYGRDFPITFNRKEAKDHGEGGNLIGASLENKRVVILDDVITAGTAFRESVQFIHDNGGLVSGLIVLLDRCEKGLETELSALEQIKQEYDVPVASVFNFFHLLAYIRRSSSIDNALIKDMLAYYAEYGAHISTQAS